MELWHTIRSLAVKPNMRNVALLSIVDEENEWHDLSDPPVIPIDLPLIAGTSCIIEYDNAAGEHSQRVVTCQRLDDHNGIQYLWAYCHLRRKIRQFRADRIIAMFDTETGEQYESPTAFFDRYRIDNSHASQPGWGLSVRERSDFLALLNALVFLARCDREFHPLERAALEHAVSTSWIRMEYRGDPDIDSILAHTNRLAPDAETFWIAMHRCANAPALLDLLRRSARDVVEADGVIAPEEFYWGSRIDEFVLELQGQE